MNEDNIHKAIVNYCDSIPYEVGKFGIAQHPLFNSFATMDAKTRKLTPITNENFEMLKQQRYDAIKKNITNEDGLFSIFVVMINKPYWIPILTQIKPFISKKDFSKLLSDFWQNTEFPHENGVYVMINLFEEAYKSNLMTAKEKKKLKELPNELIVYRGLQHGAKVRALSWTLSKEVAIWFAKRFDRKGTLYQGKIKKKDIFAYFIGRGEEEIVLNPYKLHKIEVIKYE